MRGKTAEDRRLLELLDPVAEAAGCEIVRLRLMGGVRGLDSADGDDASSDSGDSGDSSDTSLDDLLASLGDDGAGGDADGGDASSGDGGDAAADEDEMDPDLAELLKSLE